MALLKFGLEVAGSDYQSEDYIRRPNNYSPIESVRLKSIAIKVATKSWQEGKGRKAKV